MNDWQPTAHEHVQVRRFTIGTETAGHQYRIRRLAPVPDGKRRCGTCLRPVNVLKTGELAKHGCIPRDGWLESKKLYINAAKAYAAGLYRLTGLPRMNEDPAEIRRAKKALLGEPECRCDAYAFAHRRGCDRCKGNRTSL